jgi:RNA polymerase sigma factor (sigma-70 family)
MAASPLSRLVDYLKTHAWRVESNTATDEYLLLRFKECQDADAFATLVRRHGPLVWAICRRVLANEHDAEDAFQATFFVLVRKAGSIRKQTSMAAWLYGVAQRIAVKARSQRYRSQGLEEKGNLAPGEAAQERHDVLLEVSRQEVQAIVDEEIAQLPERFRAPLVLCGLSGRSKAEAARELGWKEGTVASRLDRARRRLRGRLARRGVLAAVGTCGLELLGQPTAAMAGSVVTATVSMARLLAAGEAAAGAGSCGVALALAESFLAAATLTKIRAGLALAMFMCIFAAGAGWAAHRLGIGSSNSAGQNPKLAGILAQPQNDPIGQQEKDVASANDPHGEPLPQGSVGRLGNTRGLHGDSPYFVQFLPDGKRVVTLSTDGLLNFHSIRVWECPSGKEISRRIDLPGDKVGFQGRAFTALAKDGKTIAVCPDSGIGTILYDIATGEQLATLKGSVEALAFAPSVQALAFAPDGKHLATIDAFRTIHIWDWANENQVRSFPDGNRQNQFPYGQQLAYSPDGKLLASGPILQGDRKAYVIKFWDPVTGVLLRTSPPAGLGQLNPALVFSPDGKMFAFTSGGNTITVLEAATGKELSKWQDDSLGEVQPLVFSKDGQKLYAGSGRLNRFGNESAPRSRGIREWDVATGKLSREGPSGWGVVGAMALSPDGSSLVTTGRGLPFFDLKGQAIIGLNLSEPVRALQFLPGGRNMLTMNANDAMKSVKVEKWDVATGNKLGRVGFAPALAMAVSPDGKVVARAEAGAKEVILADAATGKELAPITLEAPDELMTMCFSPDGKTLAIRQDWSAIIELYDVSTAKPLRTLKTAPSKKIKGQFGFGGIHTGHPIFFSPDGTTLASGAGRDTLGLWDLTTGQQIGSLPVRTETSTISSNFQTIYTTVNAAFSPDGRCLAVDLPNGKAGLYELASGQLRRTFGLALENGSKGKPNFQSTPKRISFNEPISCFAFSPDGQTLARAGHLRIVYLYDIQSGQELAAFKGHQDTVNAIAFTPDGKTLASASDDTTSLMWDMTKIIRAAGTAKALPAAELEKNWQALAGNDAALAFDAINELALSPKDVAPWIKERIKPTVAFDPKRVEELIAQLENTQFKVREAAKNELYKIGERIVPALDKALAANPSLEAKQRLQALRGKLTNMVLEGERLQAFRAVEVLQLIGTPEARQVLQTLAAGAPGSLVTTSAQGALQGIGKRNHPLSPPTDAPAAVRPGEQQYGGIDPQVVAAWQKAGAQFRWFVERPLTLHPALALARPIQAEALPGFRFLEVPRPGTFVMLPSPAVPFAIHFNTATDEQIQAKVTDAHLTELARLDQLQSLYFRSKQVTDKGLKALSRLKKLQRLCLWEAQITDAGMKTLTELGHLEHLDLGGTPASDVGLKEIAILKDLRVLHLGATMVTDTGMKELARLEKLQSLELHHTKVTDAGIRQLAVLQQLRSLNLWTTLVTPAGVAELQKALPKCYIQGVR